MAARLHASFTTLRDRLGDEFLSQLTYPGIYRGSPLSVSPVLVERDGALTVVVSEADSEACRVLPGTIGRSVYGRYFSWDKDLSQPVVSFSAAVRKATGGEAIECDPALPVSRYHALAETGPTTVPFVDDGGPVYLHEVSRQSFEHRWRTTRNADLAAAAPFVRSLPHGERLLVAAARTDPGYAPLVELCREKGLDTLFVTAPHDVEMFSGLPSPLLAERGVRALFDPGADRITLLSSAPLDVAGPVPIGRHDSLATAICAQAVGRIGYLPDHMPISMKESLGSLELHDASYVLKRWQDRRAGADLVYFIIAGNAVLHGFASARSFFGRAASANLTERDLVAAFHGGVRRFAERIGFAGRLSPYFDIVHSGTRTFLPATAADYPVRDSDRTIKFDMGLIAADASGCARGCSDIARTICPEPELQGLHDQLRKILVEELIPAIRPGMSGADVHAVGVDRLRPLENELRALALLPPDATVDGYRRDCGHTLQRQTISSVYFLPGVTERVEDGMLGCVEYVWPIGDVLLAVEDGYLVTADGAIPFTADVPA